jgi:hypothetical protein
MTALHALASSGDLTASLLTRELRKVDAAGIATRGVERRTVSRISQVLPLLILGCVAFLAAHLPPEVAVSPAKLSSSPRSTSVRRVRVERMSDGAILLDTEKPGVVNEFIGVLGSYADAKACLAEKGIADFEINLTHDPWEGENSWTAWMVWATPQGCIVTQESSAFHLLSKENSGRLLRVLQGQPARSEPPRDCSRKKSICANCHRF